MTVASVILELSLGSPKFKIGLLMRTCPFQGWSVICRLGYDLLC